MEPRNRVGGTHRIPDVSTSTRVADGTVSKKTTGKDRHHNEYQFTVRDEEAGNVNRAYRFSGESTYMGWYHANYPPLIDRYDSYGTDFPR